MFGFSQDKVAKATSYVPHDLARRLFGPLDYIGERLRLSKVLLWLQDEKLRYTMIRDLERLNDDYLDDIGIKKRGDIRPIVKELVNRQRERRYHPGCF